MNDKDHGRPQKKFQDYELQALFDEDNSQTQLKLVNSLNVISNFQPFACNGENSKGRKMRFLCIDKKAK